MQRILLRSKIHRATVTGASIDYEGSITIDRQLMAAADIREFEQVHVLDITNGQRLVTYAIPGEPGEISINGAAARLVEIGDLVIIVAYISLSPDELQEHQPLVVKVDEHNEILQVERTAS